MGNQTAYFFLALALVLGVARLCAAGARRLGQPAVVGEIVAGVLLGSTVLSQTWSWRHAVPYDEVQPLLGALANVGLALFMFVIGYEMDPAFLRGSGRTALCVATGSVLLPLVGGCLAALPFAAGHAPSGAPGFVLFIGVALSVTAFPVLARILADQRLNQTSVGRIAMAAAGVNDLVAWACLAVVAALFTTTQSWHMAFVPVYLALLILVVRPLAARLLRRRAKGAADPAAAVVVVCAGLMASCAATEWLGIHFVFGAFAFGAVMPRENAGERLRVSVMDGLEKSATPILLPLYFVVAGTKVDLTTFRAAHLGGLAVMLVAAVVTKMAGAGLGAAAAGLPRRTAGTLAVLMNTRGLTEIVILTVGLQLHFIDQAFYSILVVMAVLTTVMTGPLLHAGRATAWDGAPAERGTGRVPGPAADTRETARPAHQEKRS
ncbi:cation:proton antiporter [Streptomyces sp. NPDC052101]|uniref:cation:proton antiporter domain-containing protein n=1 Tax=Streptomyces sp. NPDC052101 TaxID=3155763 RepID=UPI00343DDBA9